MVIIFALLEIWIIFIRKVHLLKIAKKTLVVGSVVEAFIQVAENSPSLSVSVGGG